MHYNDNLHTDKSSNWIPLGNNTLELTRGYQHT